MRGDGGGFGLSGGERARIAARRDALDLPPVEDEAPWGLALSGGGIRSATFALGVAQGLVREGTFDRVDVLSTVSGGGYIGTFLRSLFIPAALRFGGGEPEEDAFRRRRDWALAALSAEPAAREQDAATIALDDTPPLSAAGAAPPRATNPVWWLREHGRYLAPNGGGDYGFAAAYVLRAWFAMQFVFLVTLLTVYLSFKVTLALGFLQLLAAEPEAARWIERFVGLAGAASRLKLSPLLLFGPGIALAAVLPLGAAYWMSALLGQFREDPPLAGVVTALIALAVAGAAAIGLGGREWAAGDVFTLVGGLVALTALLGLALLLAAMARARGCGAGVFDSEVRRLLTDRLAAALKALGFMLALAAIDTVALSIVRYATDTGEKGGLLRLGGLASLIPPAVWLTHKIKGLAPRVTALRRSAVSVQRFLPGLLVTAGLGLFALLGVFCAAAAYAIVWGAVPPWSTPNAQQVLLLNEQIGVAWAILAVLVAATIATGLSPAFLNLSSLHYLYAGRLTRAYLGGSNGRRLRAYAEGVGRAASVTEYDPADIVGARIYHDPRILAPIHLVNCTVNETEQTGSQLTQRDRKGANLCVGPEGVRVGDDARSWAEIDGQGAEPLPMGKWMAISGAAVSSAMGAATSLGAALMLTFANVRLGYWWYAPELAGAMKRTPRRRKRKAPAPRPPWRFRDLFETQRYLLDEATAAYSRIDKKRLALSDGGHFENSAAYELIRRRLPFIVVSDAAADPRYDFVDLANLVRKARLDLGAAVSPLARSTVDLLPPRIRALFGTVDEFRQPQGRDRLHAVLMRIDYDEGGPAGLLVLLKPRLPVDVDADIAAYQRGCEAFPQEPTVDQFFGEAQWESYRRLGFVMAREALSREATDALLGLVARGLQG